MRTDESDQSARISIEDIASVRKASRLSRFPAVTLALIGCGLGLVGFPLSLIWRRHPEFVHLQFLAIVGAVFGAFAGLALWTTASARRPHFLIIAFVWAVFFVVPLTMIFCREGSGDSVSSGIANGLDNFFNFLFFVLPSSIALGAFSAATIRICRS